ncbi:hypothetical protein [Parvularcula oceani]|uniref:hypothetical protein n=1 Tax=Parvularcula oceani TaxID=1247963 RepID=UPI0012DFE6FC|nr:hypothetical protein [Parvularcula oceani]
MNGTRQALLGATGLFVLSFWTTGAHASPWTREPGRPLSISKLTASEAEEDGRQFGQTSLETYFEWGVGGGAMIGGKLGQAWQSIEQDAFSDRLSGISEAEIFVQKGFARSERGVASGAVALAAPTSTTSQLIADRAFERDAAAEISALAGYDFSAAFVTAKLGPRLSFGDDADLLKGEVTLGHARDSGTLVLVDLYATQSLGGAAPGGVDYSLYQIAPSVVLPLFGRVALQLGARADLAGENVDLGRGAFVALWVGR